MSDVPKDIAETAFDIAATYADKDCIRDLEKTIVALLMGERERCARIAEEIADIEGTDFGSVNAILYGWPEIGECQHGKMRGQECAECPKEAREKWWLKEPME